MLKDGDIFGDGVNIATRLEGLAPPGGVCISRGIHDHVMRKLPYEFEDLGEQTVKNIAQPIRVFRIILDGPIKELAPDMAPATLEDVAEIQTVRESESEQSSIAEPSVEIVFWESIKESVRAADYAAYLDKFPNGSFSSLARARLEGIASATDGIRDPQDREVELAFWESVRASENPASLHAYLEKYPAGEFKALAEIRLEELEELR